jgi:capsular exopolysaccharide synthesis family protein
LLLPEGADVERLNGQGQTHEAFKFLRTMLTSVVEHSSKTLIFTSPDEATGKTLVASNVAISLAQLEKKVLLIDADFRVPRLHHIFALSNTLGAANILVGDASFEESIFTKTDVPGLFVLPAGPSAEKSPELIQSEGMHQLLRRCAAMFDYVILDSAPLLPVPDTIDVAKYCDEIVLVLRSRYTTRQAVEASLDLLQRAGRKLTGVVLNDVDLGDVSTLFHQSYRYGYGGYSYGAAREKKRALSGVFRRVRRFKR